jgi:plastocyanin
MSLGCGDDNPATPDGKAAEKHLVVIRDNYFSPAVLTVMSGQTVEWVNLGAAQHTISSSDGCVDSGLWIGPRLATGESFSVVFGAGGVDTSGTIEFMCIDHCSRVNMRGAIIVESP